MKTLDKLLSEHGYHWTIHRKILWSLLATRRVVFIGFSLKDPYFVKMLNFVSDDLHTYGLDSHFLILRTTKDDKDSNILFSKSMKKKYGVCTVFFEDDEKFSGLEKFIDEMEHNCLPKKKGEAFEFIKEKKEHPKNGNKETTDYLFKLSKEQDEDQ